MRSNHTKYHRWHGRIETGRRGVYGSATEAIVTDEDRTAHVDDCQPCALDKFDHVSLPGPLLGQLTLRLDPEFGVAAHRGDRGLVNAQPVKGAIQLEDLAGAAALTRKRRRPLHQRSGPRHRWRPFHAGLNNRTWAYETYASMPTLSKAVAIAASFVARVLGCSLRNSVLAASSTPRRLSRKPDVRDRNWVSAR